MKYLGGRISQLEKSRFTSPAITAQPQIDWFESIQAGETHLGTEVPCHPPTMQRLERTKRLEYLGRSIRQDEEGLFRMEEVSEEYKAASYSLASLCGSKRKRRKW
jgi:hypothetical protein